MSKAIKLFIVEGVARDYRYVENMTRCFLTGRYEAKVISLPAEQNIYMLYQKLKQDDFETDVVEVLRETVSSARQQLEGISRQQISEVYLFFDYDIQENNTPKGIEITDPAVILLEMLQYFDNETENGKLYISYPMIEAIYDYKENQCDAFTMCFFPVRQLDQYKTQSGSDNPKASVHLRIDDWRMIINVFSLRVKCLFQVENADFDFFRRVVDPVSIYRQQQIIDREKSAVFVLSALPEFLLDYFRRDFWNTMIRIKREKYDACMRKE